MNGRRTKPSPSWPAIQRWLDRAWAAHDDHVIATGASVYLQSTHDEDGDGGGVFLSDLLAELEQLL